MVIKIPEHQEVWAKHKNNEKLNPLEKFICDQEPAGKEDGKLFRDQLNNLILFTKDIE